MNFFETRLVFKIGLSVEVFGFYVGQTTSVGRLEQYEISREVLLISNLNYLTYPEVLPC